MNAMEQAKELQQKADASEQCGRCRACGHAFFWLPCGMPLVEGHIYSIAGVKEVDISGLCEFCFDGCTKEPEDEEDVCATCTGCKDTEAGDACHQCVAGSRDDALMVAALRSARGES